MYTTDDISSVLDEVSLPTDIPQQPDSPPPPMETLPHPVLRTASLIPELDDLDKALQGFAALEEEAIKEDKEKEEEMLRQLEEDATKEIE